MSITKNKSIISLLILTALISWLFSACSNSAGSTAVNAVADAAPENAEQGTTMGQTGQTNAVVGDGSPVSGESSADKQTPEKPMDDLLLTGTDEDLTAMTTVGIPDLDLQDINGAVFSSNGRLYVYDVKKGSLNEVDKTSGNKSFIGLSPDRSMAAWSYSFQTPDISSTARKIGIYNTVSGKTTELVLDDYVSQIMSISWTSDKTIMAVGHLNPSTEMYQAFDAVTGRTLFVKPVGRLYDISSDGNRIMYYFTPHFSDMMPPHIMISEENSAKTLDALSKNGMEEVSESRPEDMPENKTENGSADTSGVDYFDEPVYLLESPEDAIMHACFIGDDGLVLLEYKSSGVYLLKFAEIRENPIDIVSEFELSNVKFDPARILTMEYMADRSELHIVSSDTDDAEPGSLSINLHVLGIRNSEIISEEVIPTGLNVDQSYDISINAVGDQVYINCTMRSADKVFRRTFRVEGGKLVQMSSSEIPHKTAEALKKAVNKLLGGSGSIVIDQMELF